MINFCSLFFVYNLDELTEVIQLEVTKSKSLSDELTALKNAANIIESIREETNNIQVVRISHVSLYL